MDSASDEEEPPMLISADSKSVPVTIITGYLGKIINITVLYVILCRDLVLQQLD